MQSLDLDRCLGIQVSGIHVLATAKTYLTKDRESDPNSVFALNIYF